MPISTYVPCQVRTPLNKEKNNKQTNNISKRSRNSPNNTNSTKKQKTKEQSQKTLKSYWLGQPSNANRFEILSQIENDDMPQVDNEDENLSKSLNPQIAKPKNRKPPPIYVQNVLFIDNLNEALSTLPNCNYELKVLKDNEIKIQPLESCHYTEIVKLLKNKETQYYTYKPQEQKGFKVMLRNMHYSTDIEQIKKELCELGHEVIHVQNVLQSGTKKPLSLFAIELKTNKNNKDIYSITNLLHCKINFEPPHQKRSLPQCTNCQKYGHTKNFCTKSPVCVKCAGSHKTIQCLIKQKSDHIKCALCGAKHTANYKGCMVYKELRVKRFPPLRKKENEPKSSEAKEHNDVHQINQNINAQERSKNNPGLILHTPKQ